MAPGQRVDLLSPSLSALCMAQCYKMTSLPVWVEEGKGASYTHMHYTLTQTRNTAWLLLAFSAPARLTPLS